MKRNEFYQLVDRTDLAGIIQNYETPCYFYFLKIIQRQLIRLQECFGSRFRLLYAVKANPNPLLLQAMAQFGLGADVSSAGELSAALQAGIPPERIEFSGPGKTEEELRQAIRSGICSINVESLDELRKIIELGHDLNIRPKAGLRLNPGSTLKSGLSMSGPTQFGVSLAAIKRESGNIKSLLTDVDFQGLHFHLGSQILDADIVADSIEYILEQAQHLETELNIPIKKINFGGGWGIDYFQNQSKLDLNKLKTRLEQLFANPRYKNFFSRTDAKLELGRFLAAECGLYVTKILYVKENQEHVFAVTDGGMHHNYLLAGGMGQIIRRNFELDILSPSPQNSCKEYPLTVTGKLCSPQDRLAEKVLLRYSVYPGDYVVFFNCGAYGLSASPVNFLIHKKPAEIIKE